MSTLEKMAAAIFRAHIGFHHAYDANPVRKAHWEGIARASLQSLKDLDEGTVGAMATLITLPGAVPGRGERKMSADIFTAAINHILKDGEP